MKRLSQLERVKNAIMGYEVDRPPLLFWHHFTPGGSGDRLAEQTINFFVDSYRLDIIKIMPDLDYPVARNSIDDAVTLSKLPRFNSDAIYIGEQITCIKAIRKVVGPDYPLIMTLFSPMSYALRFIGKKKGIMVARNDQNTFMKGLEIITDNIQSLVKQAFEAVINGLFYSCMGATSLGFTRDEYRQIAQPFDKKVLQSTKKGWLNILHVHTDSDQTESEIYFDIFADYPVDVFNWSDQINGPSLHQIQKMTGKCVMGGLSEQGMLVTDDELDIQHEIDQAIKQTEGKKHILSPGCSLPNDVSDNNLHICRDYVDKIRV